MSYLSAQARLTVAAYAVQVNHAERRNARSFHAGTGTAVSNDQVRVVWRRALVGIEIPLTMEDVYLRLSARV